jgi:hypothetical protein
MTRQHAFGWEFDVRGSILVPKGATPITDPCDRVVGFRMNDGRVARLIVGLEFAANGKGVESYASEQQLEEQGFMLCDYDVAEFRRGGE